MDHLALISAWAEGMATFQLAVGRFRAGTLTAAAVEATAARLDHAMGAVLLAEVPPPLRRLRDDLLQSLDRAYTVLLLLAGNGTPDALAAAHADLDEQLRIVDAEAIRQGLAPPVDW